ncbi:sarcosine oxidase subunit delta [Seohaeicola saemankumensis]|nr:sarcosine oxidase subunit delta [Seohaeicola saemankumensis]MCA0869631.1 sarcosine oxidase subunit delta [Seohaeicola saemankumensis]
MRITCPICGERDRREFYYRGAALDRPDPEAGQEAWDDYVYLRDNPAGRTRDLWYHDAGCGSWLVVERDTVSHAILNVALALDADA